MAGGAVGRWNVTGGLATLANQIYLGYSGGSGTMCRSGGTVQAQGIVTQNSGYLYLNGGVLQAATNNTNFLNTNGLIQAGGAFFNTNGNNITISSQLVPDPNLSTTDGGLTKQGVGTLTLTNGNNSYAGGTTVSGGTLKLGNPMPWARAA